MIKQEEYQKKKDNLVRELLKTKNKNTIALSKSTSNLFRYRKQNKNTKKIDVRNFNNIISIDTKNLTAEVEGMTSYEVLVDETLRHGLMPAVVPELKSITVGGATAGVGIESSSFKYGLVHETVEEIEVLLADGRVHLCTRNNIYRDLFFGFPNSYGTFGYALKLKVKLIPVKKYVKLRHLCYSDTEKYFADLEKFSREKKVDFIDGTIFTKDEMYITLGEFVDSAPSISQYDFLNIYYKSIRKKSEDFLTVHAYIWRWDTDWFWCSKHFFVQNKLVRLLLGKKRLNSVTYSKIRRIANKYPIIGKIKQRFSRKESVIQDVEIPIDKSSIFIEFFHKEIGITPVWVCPTASYDKSISYDLYSMDPDKIYINFGFWDTVDTDNEDGYYNKKIEEKVRTLSGKKSLYSDSYYTKDVFWNLYNKKVYYNLKQKYDPAGMFPELYQKCVEKK